LSDVKQFIKVVLGFRCDFVPFILKTLVDIPLLWIRSFLNKTCALSTKKDYTDSYFLVKGESVFKP